MFVEWLGCLCLFFYVNIMVSYPIFAFESKGELQV